MSQLSVFLQKTITALLWLGGAVIFFKWLLAPLLPFLLEIGIASSRERVLILVYISVVAV